MKPLKKKRRVAFFLPSPTTDKWEEWSTERERCYAASLEHREGKISTAASELPVA
jgi:hypothetical protein